MFNFSVPVFIWIVLSIIAIITSYLNHGNSLKSNSFLTLIGIMIQLSLFVWGGFFNSLGFPQAIYIGLVFISFLFMHKRHGEIETTNFWTQLFSIFVSNLILWWGGFFG
jgi:hypothetical protein